MKITENNEKYFKAECANKLEFVAHKPSKIIAISQANFVITISHDDQAEFIQALRFCLNAIKDDTFKKREVSDA